MTIHSRFLTICCSLFCSVVAFALPVDDITLVSTMPKAGELDTELRTLENITLVFSAEVQVGPNALVTLEMPNGETLEAVPVANRFAKKNCTVDFPGYIPYNGTYKLTIKRWSVGDADWIANREEGHSNPKIEVEWTVSNGLATGVDYDLSPVSITPANDAQFEYSGGQKLAQIRIVFPNGTFLNPNAKIGLSSTEARFGQMLTFSAEKGATNTTFTAQVSPVPTISGNYAFDIPGGSFGDEDFINGNGGHANPPISLLYVVSGAQNEEGESIETVNQTFEPKSTYLICEENNYTFFLYWSKMPEVDETYLSNCKLIDEYGFAVPGATLTLTNDATEKSSAFSFSAELQGDKRYTILIPPYIFGDAEWVESKHELGSTNPQIRYDFYPDNVSVGVEQISSEPGATAPNSVYTTTGIMLYPDATEAQISALPKGFYIIARRKVIIR